MTIRTLLGLVAILFSTACERNLPTAPTTSGGFPTTPPAPMPTPPSAVAPGSSPDRISGTPIPLDVVIVGTVLGSDPGCFQNWDSSGRCRQYDITAPADGTLSATLKWAGPSRDLYDPDLFLVAPDGRWELAPVGYPEKQVSLGARAGGAYRAVVLSYSASPLEFELLVRIQR
jgi:hypothetical protein